MSRSPGPQGAFIDAVRLFQAGKLDKADRKCRQIVTADPTNVDAMHLRAMIAMHRNDRAGAIEIMQRALAIKPHDTALMCNLGNMLMEAGRPGEALARFLAAIAIDPHLEPARFGAATVLAGQGRPLAAEPHYRAILARAPRNLEALLGLAQALQGQARPEEAAGLARRAIAVAPQNPVAETHLAIALGQLNDFDGAIAAHRRAMSLSNNAPSFWLALVVSLSTFGDIAEAEAECRALIAAHPDFAQAHERLAGLVGRSSDAEMDELARLLAEVEMSVPDRIKVEFALGSALEGRKDFDAAFAHYAAGNRLAREITPYDKARTAAGFDRLKSAFTAATFARFAGAGCPDPTPVFVVGMPRSGTTLVEQILSSHPETAGANELGTIPRLFGEAFGLFGERTPAEAVAAASEEQLLELGEAYLKDLRTHSAEARFIVDKLPGNFAFLGFIELILPNATIIHCRRDPLDTCLSIYKTRFVRSSVEYGYDMAELGDYYRRYRDIMAYWQGVLPKQPVEIVYETLVAETRRESERLLEALGLDWDAACETFYETRRPVHTASMAQVRRPIYTSSVGRAERFGAALDPLRRALAGDTPGSAPAG